jgi:hypothetical protein
MCSENSDAVDIVFANGVDRIHFDDVIGWHVYDSRIFGIVRSYENRRHIYLLANIQEIIVTKCKPITQRFVLSQYGIS